LHFHRRSSFYTVWLAAFGLLGTFRFGKNQGRKEKIASLRQLSILFLGLMFGLSCGGSGMNNGGANGTPAGTYTVTVTATSGFLQHTTAATLNVQ